MRAGKLKPRGVALGRQSVDMRAAGVGQAHGLGTLVKCLAGGVVDGAAQYLHVAV